MTGRGLAVLGAAAVFLVVVQPAAPAHRESTDGVWTDPTGDAQGAAPDITTVTATNVKSKITFRIATANQPALNDDSEILLFADTDRNTATGKPDTLGADYFIDLYKENGKLLYQFGHWTGAQWDLNTPYSTVSVGYDRGATFTVDRSELGNTPEVRFWTRGLQTVSGSSSNIDDAPDDGVYSYKLQGSNATVRHVAMVPHGYPPRAGKTITITIPYVELSTGKKVRPQSYSCKATVAAKPLGGTGLGHCTFRLPLSSRGKRLTVFATARYGGSVATNNFSVVIS
jgi:hypothetical protein